MTTFNHDKFLKDSINSIINQSYDNWQLVLVDNGSTDNTKYIIKKTLDTKLDKVNLMDNNEEHKNTWNNFTKFVFFGTAFVIVLLIVLALTLL